MCVDVQDNQPCSGTYPIDRSILMDFTPSSQRGMWNAVTLGGFVHFPATQEVVAVAVAVAVDSPCNSQLFTKEQFDLHDMERQCLPWWLAVGC